MTEACYKFEKLEVCSISLKLSDCIYDIAEKLPVIENNNLKSQIIRASTSVSLNIAEGSKGTSNAEQLRYLRISLHSMVEVIACLRIIEHRNYLNKDNQIMKQTLEVTNLLFAKLNAFIKSIRKPE
ncbi:MAG: four helix bundle protein [Bacteroidia bacterium]|nr:four helix bundle protein [Bacteroidia bacterium]